MSRIVSNAALLLVFLWAASAHAQGTTPVERVHGTSQAHMLGIRFEWGRSLTYGLYYAHAWTSYSGTDGLGTLGYVAVGACVSLTTVDHSRVDALAIGPIFRGGGVTDAGGAAADLTLAAAYGHGRWRGLVAPGIFYSLYYADVGYVYTAPVFPFARPRWMASHAFGARIQIPLHEYDVHETRTVSAQ